MAEFTDRKGGRFGKIGERWSGREDLNLCPFTDKSKIFKELQEKKIPVHSEFIERSLREVEDSRSSCLCFMNLLADDVTCLRKEWAGMNKTKRPSKKNSTDLYCVIRTKHY